MSKHRKPVATVLVAMGLAAAATSVILAICIVLAIENARGR